MVQVPSWLSPNSRLPTSSTSTSGSHVTSAPPLPRTDIGPAAVHLEHKLLELYWAGVKRELPHILLTLRKWHQNPEFASTLLPDEDDLLIHGYDTFLHQVSDGSNRFYARNFDAEGEEKDVPPSYEEAMRSRGLDIFAEMKSNQVKAAIRDTLGSRDIPTILRRRARVLLQSAQFLDIDKVIEYREPEKLMTFWRRPAPPQLTVPSLDQSQMPIMSSQRCFECNKVVRGATFTNVQKEEVVICEDCYRTNHFGQPDFAKEYKTCCLAKSIHPKMSRKICNCTMVRRRDQDGRLLPLWPLTTDSNSHHIQGGMGKVNCGLFELTDMVAEAKYAATRMKTEGSTTLEAVRREEMGAVKDDNRPKKLKNINTSSRPEFGSSFGVTTGSPEDVPIFLRSITEKYPYGNVHMALRIGPVVIENGVENTGGGVLLTTRDSPQLQVLLDSKVDHQYSLLLTGSSDRHLYSQYRPRPLKRYKAMMKQIVGGAFCGLFDIGRENEIIDLLIEESLNLVDEGITADQKSKLLDHSVEKLLSKIRTYLSSRIEVYLSNIAKRLLNPDIKLRWNFQSNNCQNFCDSLIDRALFGSLFAPLESNSKKHSKSSPLPLYLMSFVCRPGAYVQYKAKSKYDVPNGLTEEYLLKFRYGRHDESDIIDTLAEYWYDWGGFEGPIYRYQDIFPWDCTEAYGRYPIRCGNCNISKHVLAFPFDSWSIISLHLARGRELYPRHPLRNLSTDKDGTNGHSRIAPGHMSDIEWFQNRLNVLLAQDSLLTAVVAMAKCSQFRESTSWLQGQEDERKDRLKLGGIHRAQPFSHHFEKGAYHQYFVADWASLSLPLRIKAYETLRDWRATRIDIKDNTSDSDGGGCGGCGGFVCGAVAAGCAHGCQAGGNDTCGSGCVSSCGSGCGSGCGGGCGGCGG